MAKERFQRKNQRWVVKYANFMTCFHSVSTFPCFQPVIRHNFWCDFTVHFGGERCFCSCLDLICHLKRCMSMYTSARKTGFFVSSASISLRSYISYRGASLKFLLPIGWNPALRVVFSHAFTIYYPGIGLDRQDCHPYAVPEIHRLMEEPWVGQIFLEGIQWSSWGTCLFHGFGGSYSSISSISSS